jgi:lipopolysaccharide/colanic/teichoic acid biosynthesis glycosyltransferase
MALAVIMAANISRASAILAPIATAMESGTGMDLDLMRDASRAVAGHEEQGRDSPLLLQRSTRTQPDRQTERRIAGSESFAAARPRVGKINTSGTDRHNKLTSTFAYEASKRIFDLLMGTILLVLAAPIVLIAALAIAIESRGSPFFVQTRLGKNGKPFRIFKLRGMYIDARQRFPELYDYSTNRGLDFFFHYENDPRVTRVGRFTRRASIDELPNFWNVIVGDMSLVGPRPEIPDVLDLYGPYRAEYLSVKPGITCVSKCTGRDRLTKRETIELDLGYIRRRGVKEDLRVLWRTFCGVVLHRDVH